MVHRKIPDPVDFQEVLLGRDLWGVQKEICRALLTSKHRVFGIKGCHGSGKTFVVSGLVPWWLLTYPDSIVLTVAPTLRQVKLMWNEITAAIKCLRFANVPECQSVQWKLSEKNYALGFSSSRGVNAQGFHAKRILLIIDEAVGISPDLWDAIDGISSSGDVWQIRLCNPTVPAGAPFEDFTRLRASRELFTISAFDTPNLQGLTLETLLALSEEELDYAPVPHLTRRRWVKDMYLKWGPLNPRFQSRVLGEFPTQSSDAVFDLGWIERAKREPTEKELAHAKTSGSWAQVGIDVAGPGDDETVAIARVNGIVIARGAWMDADPRGKVVKWLLDVHAYSGWPVGPVVVDTVGIGYNFALHIADQGFQVWGFNASQSPIDKTLFLNGKAEQYFRLRDMYKDDYVCHLPDVWDEDEAAQMSGLKYRETSRGLIEIEPKDEARERGVQSPDRAEAKMLAFAKIVPAERLVVYGAPQMISRI